jgi:hypothetical protein
MVKLYVHNIRSSRESGMLIKISIRNIGANLHHLHMLVVLHEHTHTHIVTLQFARDFNSDDFDYSRLADNDNVFMRWKEQFLVPDHSVCCYYLIIYSMITSGARYKRRFNSGFLLYFTAKINWHN